MSQEIQYVTPTKICPSCKQEFARWGKASKVPKDGLQRGISYCKPCQGLRNSRSQRKVVGYRRCDYKPCGQRFPISRSKAQSHKALRYKHWYCSTRCFGLAKSSPGAVENPLGREYCRWPGCASLRQNNGRESFCGVHEYRSEQGFDMETGAPVAPADEAQGRAPGDAKAPANAPGVGGTREKEVK